MYFVYVIKNSINDKVYVGQTRNHIQRKTTHWHCARKNNMKPLYVAMRELGSENFTFAVLEECESREIAVDLERRWIQHFDSFNVGYNLTRSGGFHVGNKGRKFSEDHKRKISEAHKGKTFSVETRRKIGEATKRRFNENHPMRGKHLSDEVRANISRAMRELYASPKGAEIRAKISETLNGTKPSSETRQKISDAGKGRKHSPETIARMKSHIFTEEHRHKLSEAARLREERKRQERV